MQRAVEHPPAALAQILRVRLALDVASKVLQVGLALPTHHVVRAQPAHQPVVARDGRQDQRRQRNVQQKADALLAAERAQLAALGDQVVVMHPFEAEIAVVTADVKMGASPDDALEGIRLLTLANDVSLRNLIPDELAKGFGFFQSKPATAFSPVAVTPDELGEAWRGGRVHLALHSSWNGRKVGLCDAGPEMTFHFGQLIAHIAKTRNVRAGSIVGSGTVSNKGVQGPGGRMEWPKGYSCIAEKRAIETTQDGQPSTEFMKFGDTIRIEMKGLDGLSVFGAIEQEIAPAGQS